MVHFSWGRRASSAQKEDFCSSHSAYVNAGVHACQASISIRRCDLHSLRIYINFKNRYNIDSSSDVASCGFHVTKLKKSIIWYYRKQCNDQARERAEATKT
jgi:hypothetical protein